MLSRIKGLRDIRTHGSLDREGLLSGVAKNLGRINVGIGGLGTDNRTLGNPEQCSWDGNASNHLYKKEMPKRKKTPIPARLIKDLLQQIAEMEEFVEEGIRGAEQEVRRLKTKLSKINK